MGDHDRALPLAEEYMRRVPDDLYAHTALATAQAFAGSQEDARKTIERFRERFPMFRLADFVAHEPFRNAPDLEKMVSALKTAGLPV